ncbi:MAG: hypothetical protein KG012_21705 [Deltaproteobacteria bacterium]|jgi:hypothetical protein|nr:hypothetical protein [Deltaproteobacteria bacterium]
MAKISSHVYKKFLQKQLINESTLVADDSMEISGEFEEMEEDLLMDAFSIKEKGE